MTNPPSLTPRGKESAPGVDVTLRPFILENPDQRTILWAIEYYPFLPRWNARLELPSSSSNTDLVTSEVWSDYINGHLKFRGMKRSGLTRMGSRELEFAMGKHAPDAIVFPDSRSSTKSGWQEFRKTWLPKLTEEGYEVKDALLVDFFDPRRGINRGRYEISADNITSGVVIDRGAIKIVGSPQPKTKSFFDGMVAFQASLTPR